MKKLLAILLLVAVAAVVYARRWELRLLWRRLNRPAGIDDVPSPGYMAPPEWQDYFRRIEEGEVPDVHVDDLIDQIGIDKFGGVANAPGD